MPSAPQGQFGPKQDDASRSHFRNRNKFGSSKDKDQDMLRQTGAHTSKGFGRIVKAAVQSPMELSMGITKGFHNTPKLWGDDTVRPQEQVSDLKSGVKAIGKEFGFGWYDGVTGLFTQPWKGAQKEGTSGFFKGIGKGIGGFATKPGAALFGIPSYMMKGIHKEVQKQFGSNVQNYIIASRTAQGYEEWLRSSDTEKQDVIVRWKLIQKYLKQKHSPDEMVRDVLETQRKMNTEDREGRQGCGRSTSLAQSTTRTDAPIQDSESAMPAIGGSQSPLRSANMTPEELLGAAEVGEANRLSVQGTARGDAEEHVDIEWKIQESVSQLQRQRQEAADKQEDEENLRQAMASSETEAQRHTSQAVEYEKQLKQVMAHSLREQRQRGSDSDWESDRGLNNEEDEEFERAREKSKMMAKKAAAVSGELPGVERPPSYDQGHLAGTTQSKFEAQQQRQQGEKTTQEKTEEEIVMEYVRKQSLLEVHHQNKGKGRATAAKNKDDEDLQKALELSMHGYERDAEYRSGEASGM